MNRTDDLFSASQGTMALESQAVGQDVILRLVDDTSRKLLAGPKKDLWEE